MSGRRRLPTGAFFAVALIAALATPRTASARRFPAAEPRTFVSQISPDLEIVTEVSLLAPYVGQQFSVLYRLRARQALAAVDIDPQQYPGFWTEMVPISKEATAVRILPGRSGVEYLLRQVVAYPLVSGELHLPALSLKIKRYGAISRQREDWDVTGASAPVEIASMPLPGVPGYADPAFVGNIEGSMNTAPDGIVLEIRGTANLALFQPLDWLDPAGTGHLRLQLASSNTLAQTVDKEGERRISLEQRQTWLIRSADGEPLRNLGDLVLPVFDPAGGSWKMQRIPGTSILLLNTAPKAPAEARPQAAAATAPAAAVAPRYVFFLVPLGTAALAAWFVWERRRRRRRRLSGAQDRLRDLEKKLRLSPRAFLESAHRFLQKYRQDYGFSRGLAAGDDLFNRCWNSVQRYRFNLDPIQMETAEELYALITQLSSGGSSDRRTGAPTATRNEPADLQPVPED